MVRIIKFDGLKVDYNLKYTYVIPMENKDLILLIVLITLVGAGLWWQERDHTLETVSVFVRTDRIEYNKNDALKVIIENNLGKSICFSSCYPYYLEKKNGGWESYSYSKCSKSDINDICLVGHQAKFFEIGLSFITEGIHRLAVPVCLNCKDRDSFREDNKFYSNEFKVK